MVDVFLARWLEEHSTEFVEILLRGIIVPEEIDKND